MARWPNTRTDKHGRYVAGGRLLRRARLRKKRDAVLDLANRWEYAVAMRECREIVGTPESFAPYTALSRIAVWNAETKHWELR
jgi:hypothetical protein